MSRARALIIPVTPFQQNCTLVWSETSKRAAVIDPGGDLAQIERAIDEAGVTVEKIWLTHGHVDDLVFAVLHCPGHSPGSVAFFHAQQRFAIVGDVLFRGSVGRSDIPGGNHQTLIASIKEKLLPLGDDVSFVCGHGPASTFGAERATNPFLR